VTNEPAIHRVFEVEAPLADAWRGLADVERWPEWAPHITSAHVSPPGALGPTSRGFFRIKGLGRTTFQMSAWERYGRRTYPKHRAFVNSLVRVNGWLKSGARLLTIAATRCADAGGGHG
jgi:hypothetical protein